MKGTTDACAHCGHVCAPGPAPGGAQARWKGRQGQRVHWSAGVRRTGTPHTRQSKAPPYAGAGAAPGVGGGLGLGLGTAKGGMEVT